MSSYIESATFDIQNGALSGTMTFRNGLNLLSGENGTFKTKLLQALRDNPTLEFHEGQAVPADRFQAISPKRNAQRRAAQQIFDELRRNNTKIEALLNARTIDDTTFEAYPSLGELFYVVYDDLCRDGGDQVEKMKETAEAFNGVIKRIFEHYELQALWDANRGEPAISLLKHGVTEVPLEGLSLGEQEILSLAVNIHSSRDRFDIYLIDEPEVHLNWHLEEKLFNFLDDFCDANDKQMVVVTHSRVVFTRRFMTKTTFLFWEGGEVKWGPELHPEQRRRIAGDAIEIIRLGTFSKRALFVEDECHAQVAEQVTQALGSEILVTPCGNKANLRSLYRLSNVEGWSDSFFVEDGDNEGATFTDPHFVHLDKYCIECYLLNPSIAAIVAGRPEGEIRQLIFDSILEKKEQIFRKNKFFEFLIGYLTVEHMTDERIGKLDASIIMTQFLGKLGMSQADYIERYVQACQSQGVLKDVLPERLVEVIEAAVPEPPEPTAVTTNWSQSESS